MTPQSSGQAWLDAEKPKHLPKGPMGAAIGYALNQWETLTRFLDDARVPVDNNKAENALRAVGPGKKNGCSWGTTRPARTWPASTRSSPPARRTA